MNDASAGGGALPASRVEDRDELRLALSLKGGVSLAVWIGGVTHEVDEVVRASATAPAPGTSPTPGTWSDALELMATNVVVDVISGTSAGGICGAVLAQAIAHGTSTEPMRRLWVTDAGIERLLRDPAHKGATSLFRGDDYMLDLLRTTFTQLGGTSGPQGGRSIDLTLTGTLLNGVPNQLPDDFGTVVADVRHRANFRFRRDPRTGIDHFSEAGIAETLARAARSTSAFPGAFEASFVRVVDPTGSDGGAPSSAGSIVTHPNMRDHVDFPRSRWVIDGGVLANQPLEDTLRTIYEQRVDGQVRRSVLLVSPDPAAPEPDKPDDGAAEPGLVDVLRGTVMAPWVQSLAADLRGYRRHNEQVRRLNESRDAVVVGMSAAEATAVADSVFPVYRETRRYSSARFVRQQFVEQITRHLHDAAVPDWERDAIYRLVVDTEALPWLPADPPGDLASVSDLRSWGLFPLERAIGVLIDVLVRTLHAADEPHERALLSALLARCYDDGLEAVTATRRSTSLAIERLIDQTEVPPGAAAGADPAARAPALRGWACSVVRDWIEQSRADAGLLQQYESVAGAVAGIAADLGPVLASVAGTPGPWTSDDERATLEHWAQWFGAAGGDPVALLRTLLVFEVLENAFGNNRIETPQVLRFVQVSGDTPCPSLGALPISKKITGVQLGHFGAFLKRSWRANDWMWGRLDGSANLSRVLLDPARLRQLYPPSPTSAGLHPGLHPELDPELGRLTLLLIGTGPDAAYLESRLPRDRLVAETAFLREHGRATPPSLPEVAQALARRRNLEILRQELPHLDDAIGSAVEGAPLSQAEQDFRQHYRTLTRGGQLSAAHAEELLGGCRIGAETASDEVGTPRLTTTAVKTFAAAANTLDTAAASAKVLTVPAGALRGVALAAYRLQTAKDTSPVTRWAVASVLSSALTIAILGAFVQGIPAWLQGAAWAVLVAAVVLRLVERPSPPAALVALGVGGALGVATWLVLRDPIDLVQVSVVVAGCVAVVAAVGTLALLRRLGKRRRAAPAPGGPSGTGAPEARRSSR